MNDNLKEMIEGKAEETQAAPTQEQIDQIATEATTLVVEEITTKICDFSKTLGEDVKVVNHKNTFSLKRKNRNFGFVTKTKKNVKLQVKNGSAWDTINVMAVGEPGVQAALKTAYEALE